MKSIQSRFIVLVLAAIFISIVVVGAIATFTAVQKTDSDAGQIINLTCENESHLIDSTLDSLERSVDTSASYATSILESPKKLFEDDAYRQRYTADVERLFADIAKNTDGAVAYYYRFNADIVDSTEGFLYVKNGVDEPFENIPPTDIKEFDPDDDEHVGWYYIPKRHGRATWLDPYQNLNLDIYMISYVVPIYIDGVFVGVIGMDINFQVIIDQLKTIHPLNNGYAFLAGKDATVMFHPLLEYGVKLDDVGVSKGGMSFESILAAERSEDDLVEYTQNGTEKKMAFETLRNGMVLATVANTSDINASRNTLVMNIAIASIVILLLAMIAAYFLTRRMMRPLSELTETARQVAAGNLNAKIPEARFAEVATLVDAYRVTVDTMRQQMDFIEELAHRDALTKLWNKSAYDKHVAELDKAIARGDARFAIVMIDVNDLKYMNDGFGHNKGDDYLLNAVELIGDTFGREHVYRIGGDEFVVIVEGDELNGLDGNLAKLEAAMGAAKSVRNMTEQDEPWQNVSIAYGCVRFDSSAHSSSADVFEQADAAMYAHKSAAKANE